MAGPEGSLTVAQFEILQQLWSTQPHGLSVAEIWERTRADRDISRTTILNLVDRLEKRGWLKRRKVDGVFRYQPAVDRDVTEARMAGEFVGNFFSGSTSQFMLSLLGSRKISTDEIRQLQEMLEGHDGQRPPASSVAVESKTKKKKG